MTQNIGPRQNISIFLERFTQSPTISKIVQEVPPQVEPDFLPTRQTLLSRLKDWNDQDSWKDFFDNYWKLIFTAAIKSGLNETEAQEAVQETVISVCKSVPDFQYNSGKGSFKKWLLTITRRRIADQFRKRDPYLQARVRKPDDTRQTGTLDRIPDTSVPDLDQIWDQEWEQNLVESAIERVKTKVDPKQFQIFDLYVLRQWTVSKVSQSLQVSAARIYLAKHRISALVKKEIKLLESKSVLAKKPRHT